MQNSALILKIRKGFCSPKLGIDFEPNVDSFPLEK